MSTQVVKENFENVEPELEELIVYSYGISSVPKKLPLKAASDIGKLLKLLLPKSVTKVVIVISREHIGSDQSISSSVKSAYQDVVVTVMFSHKLDKDTLLVYYK